MKISVLMLGLVAAVYGNIVHADTGFFRTTQTDVHGLAFDDIRLQGRRITDIDRVKQF